MKTFLALAAIMYFLLKTSNAECLKSSTRLQPCNDDEQQRTRVETKCSLPPRKSGLLCKNISVTSELPLQLTCKNFIVKQIRILNSSIPVLYPYSFIDYSYLTDLTLAHSKISTLKQDAFFGLNNLKKLRLKYNNMTELNPGIFSPLSNLTMLNVTNNYLKTLHPGCFSNLTSLEELNLSMNRLNSVFRDVFESLPQLQTLRLNDNFISEIQLDSLVKLPQLQNLYLNHNLLEFIDCRVFKSISSLVYLNVSYNRLTHISQDCFDSSSMLKELHLKENWIAYFDVKKFLSIHRFLEKINLSANQWDCVCLKDIMEALKVNKVEVMEKGEKSGSNVEGIACMEIPGQTQCKVVTENFQEDDDVDLASKLLFSLETHSLTNQELHVRG